MPIDYKRYPATWKKEIVPRILKREGNCCKWCDLANREMVYSVAMRVKTDGGAYKVKRFWLRTESDLVRIQPFCIGPARRVRVILTIAHLDHDEENHEVEDERLAALCQYCHLNYDASEKMRRAFAKKELAA